MALVREKKGRDGIVGLNRTLYDSAEAWALAKGYTLKSVIETAVEEFLERHRSGRSPAPAAELEDEEEDTAEDAPPPAAPIGVAAFSVGSLVVARIDGRGPERLGEVLEHKSSGNVKVRIQTFGSGKQKWTDHVLANKDIVRAQTESESSKWRAIAGNVNGAAART